MSIRIRWAWRLAAGLILSMSAAALAVAQAPVTVPAPGGDVSVLADRLEEIGPERILIATGNVEMTRGTARLLADRVEINRDTGDAVATGRVIFYDGDDRLSAERIDYNFRTGTGVVYDGEARSAPYYRLSGERMERIGQSIYRVRRGVFTTCEADPPAWSVRLGSAVADLETRLTGRNASFWVRDIPLIPFLPYFSAAIRRERQTGVLFPRFGFSSNKGYFAEVPFYWAISDSQDATFGLQGYQKRGIGLSAEYRYVLSREEFGYAKGFVVRETALKNADRGYGAFRHDWPIRSDLTLKIDIKGVTDDSVFRDYGDRLEQLAQQRVESNVFLTKTWPTWDLVAAAFVYQDLTTPRAIELNRLPEITLRSVRQPIPGLPGFLYDVESSAVRFVREVGSDGTRVDIHPRVSRPISPEGLVTVTPFVGGRLTAYDRRVIGTQISARDGRAFEITEDDPRVRRLLEAGTDMETTISKVYAMDGRFGLASLLHSIEPRFNYTWIGGYDTTQLPFWSQIDRIGHSSQIEYSVTNRIRGKTVAPEGAEGARFEMVRLVLGHSYDLQNRRSGDVVGDLLLQTGRLMSFRGDLRYNTQGDGLQSAGADLALNANWMTATVRTRFSPPSNVDFLSGKVNAQITPNVIGHVTTNWDLRTDTFVENRVGIDLRFQCYAFALEYVTRARGRIGQGEDQVRFTLNLLGLGQPITNAFGLGALTSTGGTSSR